jgi:hypothetical protein
MDFLEYEINQDRKGTEEQDRAFINMTFSKIANLKSYCEIEIYLEYLADVIGKTKEEISKDFNSKYVDKNNKDYRFVVSKYSRG